MACMWIFHPLNPLSGYRPYMFPFNFPYEFLYVNKLEWWNDKTQNNNRKNYLSLLRNYSPILLMQVAQIRNSLAHIKQGSSLGLDDQTFNAYWTDMTTLVNSLPGLNRPYFTTKTAQDVIDELNTVSLQISQPL